MKPVKKVLKWGSLGMAVVLAVLVAVNARDEAPDPGIKDFVATSAPAVADGENAFFMMLGFDAPLDQDARAFGMQIAAQHEAAVKRDPYVMKFSLPQSAAWTELFHDKGLEKLVWKTDEDCRKWRTLKSAELDPLLNKYGAWVARYETLLAYPRYRLTLTATDTSIMTPVRMHGYAIDYAHQLELAKAALAAQKGDLDSALAVLGRDARFWRKVLREADDKETKVDAYRIVEQDMRLLSAFLSTEKLSEQAAQQAQGMLAPLSAEERDFGPALRREFMVIRQGAEGIAYGPEYKAGRYFDIKYILKHGEEPAGSWAESLDDVLYKLFYKPNATVNRYYREFASVAAKIALPAAEFVKQLPKDGPKETLFGGMPNPTRLDFIYNPLGKRLNSIYAESYQCNQAWLHNLDGLIRLVSLQFRAKQQGVAADAMEGFLRSADPALANPYTQAPMQFDKQTQQLYFMGVGCKLAVDQRVAVTY